MSGSRSRADFPHGLRIHVIEPAGGVLAIGGSRVLPWRPTARCCRAPSSGRCPRSERARRPEGGAHRPLALARLHVARRRPARAARAASRVRDDGRPRPRGTLRDGPELVFGGAARLRAKWARGGAGARRPDAQGAAYVDVRLPERPAVGGLASARSPARAGSASSSSTALSGRARPRRPARPRAERRGRPGRPRRRPLPARPFSPRRSDAGAPQAHDDPRPRAGASRAPTLNPDLEVEAQPSSRLSRACRCTKSLRLTSRE